MLVPIIETFKGTFVTKVSMDFNEFDLHETLMKGITDAGYVTCTPVQEQVLKGALEGADLYVQSQTGTGKTAAYLISIIQELLTRDEMKGKKALIMVPTRELAVQVEQEAKCLSSHTGLKCASFYGGVGYTKQTDLLKKEVDILVGTPGRVIDLQESGTMDLSALAFLVVDEADRMFDMGFYPDLRKLINVLPPVSNRQTLLFSATLNSYVKNLAWEYTENAKEITIESDQITVDEIDQVLVHVSSEDKTKLLLGIIRNEKPESSLIFCNTKRSCEVLSKRLTLNGIETEFIIGDLPQSKRLQVLESFKRGSLKCLVATDVAARGIDVNDLSMVINYDLPNESENYVHRIGRTARAGKTGKAYTFCSEQDVYNLPGIERYIEKSIPSTVAIDDMLSDDKSEGMYIRTDSYGDNNSNRPSRGRGGNRSSSQSRSSSDNRNRRSERPGTRNASYTANRPGPKQQGAAKPRPEGNPRNNNNNKPYGNSKPYGERSFDNKNRSYSGQRSSNYQGSHPRPYNGKPRNPQGQNRYDNSSRDSAQENLSALPFEERMKLYKEKYGNKSSIPTKKAEPYKKNNAKTNSNRKKMTTKTTLNQKPGPVKASQKSKDKQSSNTQSKGFFGKIISLFK